MLTVVLIITMTTATEMITTKNMYHVPGTMLRILCILAHVLHSLSNPLREYKAQVNDEETETQRRK